MQLFNQLEQSLTQNAAKNAFCFNGHYYSYFDLSQVTSNIRKLITNNIPQNEKVIAILANDDIETYASILALWFEGKSYVPLNPDTPLERNKNIIHQAEIKYILDSSSISIINDLINIKTSQTENTNLNIKPAPTDDSELAYILFTSGTTGTPKGVPINRQNLSSIIDGVIDMNIQIDSNDRCLQMSQLTFDVSITSFLYPLLFGACVYTIPVGKIKFSYIYELLEEKKLTVATLVPSILNYFRQYFEEMNFPLLKYCLITAEALPTNLVDEWSACIPNARILNLYGPTENTVWSTFYEYNRKGTNKSHNGILSIGKKLKDTELIIIDSNNDQLPAGHKGELCLCGNQLTNGYWKNDEKNLESFFIHNFNNMETKFYKTGDLVQMDTDGDILYMGRIDFQAKIQGFRVELSEIDFHCKAFSNKLNVVALAAINSTSNTEIWLVIEGPEFDTKELILYLKQKLPPYMIPSKIYFINEFPINMNDKIDRNMLLKLFGSNQLN